MALPVPTASSSRWTLNTGHKLKVVRKPYLRVRQAVRDNNVSLLSRLQHKTDLRNTDKDRLTSLSWAAIEGSLEVFEWLLLDYGHDDQELSRDADNNTIFHLLASVPSPPTLSPYTHLLLSSPNFPPLPPTKSLQELTAISCRMTEIYHTLFPFLLDWSNSGGKTALHVAAQAGNSAFIALLCDLGADVDLTDLQGNSPLHYASAWGHLDSIRVLLERGCQFAARNFEGFTASDFAYSQSIMKSLQDIARDLFEERRTRRKGERLLGERSTSSLGHQQQGSGQSGDGYGRSTDQRLRAESASGENTSRLRSGSVSTSASVGSGLSSGGSRYVDASSAPPLPSTYPDVRTNSTTGSRERPSSPPPPPPHKLSRMGSDGPRPSSRSTGMRSRTQSESQTASQNHSQPHYTSPSLGPPLPRPPPTGAPPPPPSQPPAYPTRSPSLGQNVENPGSDQNFSRRPSVSTSMSRTPSTNNQSSILSVDQLPMRTREGSLSSTYSASAMGAGGTVGLGVGLSSGGLGMRRANSSQSHGPGGQI